MPKRAAARPSISLSYVGGEVTNIPARDLSADDLVRLANEPWVRRRIASDPQELAETLIASGVYVAAAEAAASQQPSAKE